MPKKHSDKIAEVSWDYSDVPDNCNIRVSGILVSRVNISVDAPNNLFGFPLMAKEHFRVKDSKQKNLVTGQEHTLYLEYKKRKMFSDRGHFNLFAEEFDTKENPDRKDKFVYAVSVTLVNDKGGTLGRNIYVIQEVHKGKIVLSSQLVGNNRKEAKINIGSGGDYAITASSTQNGEFVSIPLGCTRSHRKGIDASYDVAHIIYGKMWKNNRPSYKQDERGSVKTLFPINDALNTALHGSSSSSTSYANESLQLTGHKRVKPRKLGLSGIQLPEGIRFLAHTNSGVDIFGTYPNKKLTMLNEVANNIRGTRSPDNLATYIDEQALKLDGLAMTYRIIAEALRTEQKNRDNGAEDKDV